MENNRDLQIVKITNISHLDFTGETGARFNGRDYSIPAGKSLRCPLTLGEHLAKHLARMILLNNDYLQNKNSELAMWSPEAEQDMINKILSYEEYEENEIIKTEDEILAEKISQLNSEIGEDIINTEKYSTKAEVIKELEAKKITFNPRVSKAELEKLLNEQQ